MSGRAFLLTLFAGALGSLLAISLLRGACGDESPPTSSSGQGGAASDGGCPMTPLPMFTVTHGTIADLEPVAPTAPYLRWIAAGLAEAHGWNTHQVVDYLHAAPGVQTGWTSKTLTALLAA